MSEKQQPLGMKHTVPQFWLYAIVYILLGSGTFLIVADVAEWAFAGKTLSLVGVSVIWFGVIGLTVLNRSRPKDSPPDNTEDKR